MLRPFLPLLILTLLLSAFPVSAADPQWQLALETGPAWFSRNDARIPNDGDGDRFDVTDLTGSGPTSYFRLGFEYQWGERHAITGLFAPFRAYGTSSLSMQRGT